MCKFCVGMLTGVVVCLACLGVGLTLLHSGTISLGSTANASKDDPEPIPELADPVPVLVPSEPAPLPAPSSALQPSAPVAVAPEELTPPTAPVTPVTDVAAAVAQTVALPQVAPPPVDPPPPVVPPPEPPSPTPTAPPSLPPVSVPWPPPPVSETLSPPPPVSVEPVSAPASAPVTLAVRSTTTPREPALFLGSHRCALDEERRLKLPAAVREQWGEVQTICLTPGPDQCLVICSEAVLPSLLESKLEAASGGEGLAARRRFFACTERVKVDAEGNCCIPAALTELVGLTRDVVIIGVGAHWELWDAQRWQQYLRQEKEIVPAGASAPLSVESGPR